MIVTHLKKKDVVKSEVRGVDSEFDHEKLATILGRKSEVGRDETFSKGLFILRRLVNLPRVMMRHMSYVISVKDHELPYGDWLTMVFEAFGVPLVDKRGEESKRYDFFEETFLTMCKLTRENGIWWIGSGENRRRDDDEATQEEEAEDEDEGNRDDFEWEAIIDEATVEGNRGRERSFMILRKKLEALRKRMMRFSEATPDSARRRTRA
ncbi:hypothetical protein Dimus_007517 [Dionaea muscipula]